MGDQIMPAHEVRRIHDFALVEVAPVHAEAAWTLKQLAESHEELRARLERAERERDEMREALRAITTCYVTAREAQGWPNVEDLPAVKMVRVALGAASERGAG